MADQTVQPNFSTAISTTPRETRIYLRGELDMESAPALNEALEHALAAGAATVVIDCAGLSYCDSFGIRSVLIAGLRSQRAGISLRIEHADGTVRRILEISGVTEVISLD